MDAAHYIAIVDSFPDPIILSDTSGRILSANRAFERLSGYAHGELTGEDLTRLLDAGEALGNATPDEGIVPCAAARIRSARHQRHIFRHKTGRPFVADAWSQPIEIAGATGAPAAFYTRLREPPQSAAFVHLFETFLERTAIGHMPLDQWCSILFEAVCDYLGLDFGAVYDPDGRSTPFLLTNINPPDGPDARVAFLDPAFCAEVTASSTVMAVSGPADGAALQVGPIGPCAAHIAMRVALFGKTSALVLFCAREPRPTPFDDMDRIAMKIVARMIAGRASKQQGWDERARIAGMLAESEGRYRTLFRALPAMMMFRDPGGLIADVTDMFAERFGFNREELIGTRAIDMMPESTKPHVRRAARRVAQPGGTMENEPFEMIAKSGEVVDIEVSAKCQRDGSVLAVVVDVSERNRMRGELERRNSELERANESLKHFTSIASHDIQEPLRKIRYFSDLLRQAVAKDNSTDISYSLDVLTDASQRASVLVSDLLDFSRASNKELDAEAIDLRDLVEGIISELCHDHGAQRTQFTLDAPRLTVTGDRTAIIQLFRNLLCNALKYRHPDRLPQVTIAVDYAADGGRPAEIRIADNGIGFEAEYAEMILKPFTRLHRRSQYPGSGVGLAICDVVARRHNWGLRAEGRPGEGAVFTISIPAYAVPAG